MPNSFFYVDVHVFFFYRRLCLATEGVLYEDGFLQIGMKSEYQREMGRIMFYYGNSSMTPLTNFTTSITPSSIQFQPQPTASTIAPKAQVQQLVTFVCTSEFSDPPVMQISFVYVLWCPSIRIGTCVLLTYSYI